jgi:hypothetical protein
VSLVLEHVVVEEVGAAKPEELLEARRRGCPRDHAIAAYRDQAPADLALQSRVFRLIQNEGVWKKKAKSKS